MAISAIYLQKKNLYEIIGKSGCCDQNELQVCTATHYQDNKMDNFSHFLQKKLLRYESTLYDHPLSR